MKRHYLVIKSAGASVLVVTKNNNWEEKLLKSKFLKRYVPCSEIYREGKKENAGATLFLSRGKKSFGINFPNASYSNNRYDDRDIVSYIELLLERLRQSENRAYCMHSASVELLGRGIIFWGWASGIGKTSLAIALAKKYRANFFSDEKTLIDLDIKSMIGGICSIYPMKNHTDKKFSGFCCDYCRPVKIGFFVYPHVSKSGPLLVEKWDNKKFDWHLYEELSRKIRGVSRRFFGNRIPAPSIDTEPISRERSRRVSEFVKNVPCYYMRGTEKQICKKIIELLDKKQK